MRRLVALLAFTASVVIGGTVYIAARPDTGVTREDLLDAGAADLCDVRVMTCQMRWNEACRDLPDGGRRRAYLTVARPVLQCDRIDGGAPVLIFPPRPGINECLDPVGPPDTACQVTDLCGDGGTLCDDQAAPAPVASRCACRQPDAGQCRVPNPDGGTSLLAPIGVTLRAFGGPGCVRKSCEVVAGDTDSDGGDPSWPEECPL